MFSRQFSYVIHTDSNSINFTISNSPKQVEEFTYSLPTEPAAVDFTKRVAASDLVVSVVLRTHVLPVVSLFTGTVQTLI
jgi:hypothetical protein